VRAGDSHHITSPFRLPSRTRFPRDSCLPRRGLAPCRPLAASGHLSIPPPIPWWSSSRLRQTHRASDRIALPALRRDCAYFEDCLALYNVIVFRGVVASYASTAGNWLRYLQLSGPISFLRCKYKASCSEYLWRLRHNADLSR